MQKLPDDDDEMLALIEQWKNEKMEKPVEIKREKVDTEEEIIRRLEEKWERQRSEFYLNMPKGGRNNKGTRTGLRSADPLAETKIVLAGDRDSNKEIKRLNELNQMRVSQAEKELRAERRTKKYNEAMNSYQTLANLEDRQRVFDILNSATGLAAQPQGEKRDKLLEITIDKALEAIAVARNEEEQNARQRDLEYNSRVAEKENGGMTNDQLMQLQIERDRTAAINTPPVERFELEEMGPGLGMIIRHQKFL